MLQELHIENFAIIEKQVVSFHPGLNVISGETGAGKSVVLQALELLLGGRAKGPMVRTGAESWALQALFDISYLDQENRSELPDYIQGDELVVSRTMTREGRGRVYINGQLSTLVLLEQVCRRLINVCGQGHHMQLLDPAYHLDLIDRAGNLQELKVSYRKCYREWKAADVLLQAAEKSAAEVERRRAELEFVIEDLESLTLYEGRREELEAAVRKASAIEVILESGQTVREFFDGEQGAFSNLSEAVRQLHQMARHDPSVTAIENGVELLQEQLQDLSNDLNRYLSDLDVDEAVLEQQRDELASIARLERKYATNTSGLLSLLCEAKEELKSLADTHRLEKLGRERDLLLDALKLKAAELGKKRKKAGRTFAAQVAEELKELNMPDTILEFNWEETAPSESGAERVEFLISTNRGEEVRPLRKIASGGELSRITLVLKKLLNDRAGVNVLVFDEVDTGISGKVARAVGEKLKALSGGSQVICITHLPQVASLADVHLLVQKERGKRTFSVIRPLSDTERVDEIARMLSGFSVTEAGRESARELLAS